MITRAGGRQGFTLVELLVFTGIFAVIIVAFIAIFTATLGIQSKQSSQSEANQQSVLLSQRIQGLIEKATYVDLAEDTASTTLTLRMASSSEDPTTIYLSSSTVYIQSGSSPAEALTSGKVSISGLTFTKHANYPGHDVVAIQFTVESASGPAAQASFETAVAAATSNPAKGAGYSLASDSTPANDAANAIALDTAGGAMYVAGYDGGGSAGSLEWRIEKRNLSDGSLVYATTSDPTTVEDAANSIALDTSAKVMWLAGYEYLGGEAKWRIEKRNLSDGSLVRGVTPDPSTGNDEANTIAIDVPSDAMYVAGYEYVTGSNYEWRIEKRTLSGDNTLLYSQVFDPATGGDNEPNAIALDTAGGAMYVAGYQHVGASDSEWRIEKRNLSDGSLAYAATENLSAGDDIVRSVALDAPGGAMYVAGYASSTSGYIWRIEKRNLSDGSLVYAVTSTAVSAQANAIAIDTAGGAMYVAGYANVSGPNEWRIEKRNLSDGSLVYAATDLSLTADAAANAIAVDPAGGSMYLAGFDSGGSGSGGSLEWRIEKRNLSDGSTSTVP